MVKFVTIHGLGAAHSNDSGRYLEFCCAKIAPHSSIIFSRNAQLGAFLCRV